MDISNLKEILFSDGTEVAGDTESLSSITRVPSAGLLLDNTSGLPTLSPWRKGVLAWDSVNNVAKVSSTVEGVWVTFNGDHNSLSSSGGLSTEKYHLTQAQANSITTTLKKDHLDIIVTERGSVTYYAVCWSSALSMFVAAGNVSSNTYFYKSADGFNWDKISNSIGNVFISDICWSQTIGKFCASAGTGSNSFYISSDGINWTGINNGSRLYGCVCWSPSLVKFCAISYNSNYSSISADGITWTNGSVNYSSRSICWSQALAIFCAVSSGVEFNARTMVSTDGINWTYGTIPNTSYSPYCVCWSEYLSRFLIISNSNGNNYYSTTGTNFNSILGGQNNEIAWSQNLKVFLTIGGAQYTKVSRDGVTWVRLTTALDIPLVNRCCFSDDLNRFVAVGSGLIYCSV